FNQRRHLRFVPRRASWHVTPDFRFGGHDRQIRRMCEGQRLQSHKLTAQCYRLGLHYPRIRRLSRFHGNQKSSVIRPSSYMQPPRFNVLGVGVSALSLDSAAAHVLEARGKLRLGYVCVCTVHGISEAQRDESLRRIFNASYLTTPDGMPLVWLGRHHRHHQITRVYGPDLLLKVCDEGRQSGLRHYFYGGQPGVAEALSQSLVARFPELNIVGTFTPP